MHHAASVSESLPPIVKAAWASPTVRGWIVVIGKILLWVLGVVTMFRGPQWVESRVSRDELNAARFDVQALQTRAGVEGDKEKGILPVVGSLETRIDALSQAQALWSKEQREREVSMLRRVVVIVAAQREPTRARKKQAAGEAGKEFDDNVKDGMTAERALEKALGLDE